jgi:hypothetical protein
MKNRTSWLMRWFLVSGCLGVFVALVLTATGLAISSVQPSFWFYGHHRSPVLLILQPYRTKSWSRCSNSAAISFCTE